MKQSLSFGPWHADNEPSALGCISLYDNVLQRVAANSATLQA
jgi:hypothetical protein